MDQDFPKLTLILGGANSGKSVFAELLTRAAGLPKTYVATAQAFDDEMRDKIAAHRVDRGDDWDTIEAPMDIISALGDGVTLVDCLSMWLTNHMLAEVDLDTSAFLAACDAPVICVSNEVGMGVIPDNILARQFLNLQGQLNQDIAAAADLVVLVTAGIPMVLKGRLPQSIT
tara:strand:- start:13369 stop:13884 length:516 start_codon:yes stop_codon:yes gene_type:complete